MEEKPIKILFVEDDSGYVRLIKEMLKEYNRALFEPTHVTKLAGAIKHLKTETFDVVLLDLNLPDSWGFETFEKLRAESPSITIVVLTGMTDEDLEKSRQKFRNLSAHLQDLREAERKYIAAELHDELGGLFTAIKMELSLMTSNTSGNQEKLRRAGESLVKLADTGIETVRRISMELRPEILDHLGLISAIQWYMSEFQKRARIRCKCLLSKEDIQMNKNRTTAVFRILQEAMTNVARHSEATKVTVEVKKDEDTMIMKIEDNGKGINEEKINDPFSFGLLGMQERTLYLGGELKISGTPNKGTRVMATIPISEKWND